MAELGKTIIIVLIIIAVFACEQKSGLSQEATEVPITQISGKVTDAIIVDATVNAYQWNEFSGECEQTSLGTAFTDAQGNYEIAIQELESGWFCVTASQGYYIEEASGTKISLTDGQTLSGIVKYEHGKTLKLQVTPATNMVLALAKYNLQKGGYNPTDAVNLATSSITDIFGVNIHTTRPLDVTNILYSSSIPNDGLRYGMMLAALSSLTAEMAESQDIAPHSINAFTSIAMAQTMYADLLHDGALNGIAAAEDGQEIKLGFGAVPLDASVYRDKWAGHILSFANNEKNKSTLTAKDFLAEAQSLAGSTSSVYGGVDAGNVDLTGPIVKAKNQDGQVLQGLEYIQYTSEDLVGIFETRLYLGDRLINSGSGGTDVFELDTTLYPDGEYSLILKAKDTLENETVFTQQVRIDNTAVAINITSPTTSKDKFYKLTGTWSTPSNDVKEIYAYWKTVVIDRNGDSIEDIQEQRNPLITEYKYPATVNEDGTWEVEFELLRAGVNHFVVKSEDSVGNMSHDIEMTVGVDDKAPYVDVIDTYATYTALDGQWDNCTHDRFTLNAGKDDVYPVCIRSDKVSLNGRFVNDDLLDNDFVVINFEVEDRNAEISTPNNDLVVEYRYIFRENEAEPVIDWKALPKRFQPTDSEYVLQGNNYMLPITSEYLGDNFYNYSADELHQIDVRVTDGAGNSSTTRFNLKFDVLQKLGSYTENYLGDAMMQNYSFNTRHGLSNQQYKIEYIIENTGRRPIWIKFEDSTNNQVFQRYESKVRKNRIRSVSKTEEWMLKDVVYKPQEHPNYYFESVSDFCERNKDSYLTEFYPQYLDARYVFYGMKTVSISNTNVSHGAWHYTSSDVASYSGPHWSEFTSAAPASSNNDFVARYKSNDLKFRSTDQYTPCYYKRSVSYYETESGYPKNESSLSDLPTVDFNNSSISVYDLTWNRNVISMAGKNGGYYMGGGVQFKVTKTVTLPSLSHFNDLEVASSNFNSYTTKNLDKYVKYYIDTDLTMLSESYEDEGADPVTNVVLDVPEFLYSVTTTKFGDGRKFYEFVRE